MIPYIAFALLSVIAVFITDIRLNTKLIMSRRFWIFQVLITVLTIVVDSYSSGLPIIIFNDKILLGIRFFNVPLENFLFGFSLITFNLIMFELFAGKKDGE
jgi:lycopene cyclase domain-containing protein